MVSPITYFRETWDEMKKVKWPSRSEVTRLTATVMLISVLVGMYIGGLDYVFTKLMELILK